MFIKNTMYDNCLSSLRDLSDYDLPNRMNFKLLVQITGKLNTTSAEFISQCKNVFSANNLREIQWFFSILYENILENF